MVKELRKQMLTIPTNRQLSSKYSNLLGLKSPKWQFNVFEKNGGVCAKLPELAGAVVSTTYKLHWEQKREYLDLTELARLRWIERWSIGRLARYFGLSKPCVKERLRRARREPSRAGIDPSLIKKIRCG